MGSARMHQSTLWGLGLLCPEITGQGREVDFHTLERRLGFRVEGLGSGVMATFGIPPPQAKKLKVSRPLKSQEKCALAPVIAGSFPKARKHHQHQSGRALGKYTCASEHHQRQLPRPWSGIRLPTNITSIACSSRFGKPNQEASSASSDVLEAGIHTNPPASKPRRYLR